MNTDWRYHTDPLWERACSRRGHPRHHRVMSSTFKRWRLIDTSRHALRATHPCAIAYSYARIRRLVRLGVGFYCGSIADESAIGFSDSNSSQRCISVPGFVADLYFRDFVMVAVCGRPSGLPGAFDRFANLRTAATLACLATGIGGSANKGASPCLRSRPTRQTQT